MLQISSMEVTMQRVAHGLLSGLVCAPALVGALATGCVNGPIDPIELIATDITVDAEHPELSRLPDGTLAQRYIVVLRNDLLAEGYAPGIISDLALTHDVRMERVYTTALGGFAAALTADQVSALEARPDVAFVVADLPVHAIDNDGDNGGGNDPGGEARPGGGTTTTPASDWGLADVLGADYASRTFGAGNGGAGVIVSVLDTGVDTDHPSLPASAGCLGDFTGENLGCEDVQGHGTHVTGTIAALASGSGTTTHRGLASNVSLVPGRVLNSAGSGSNAGIAAAIDAAAANGSDVINMSLGGATYGSPEATDPLCVAITNAAAAGTLSAVAAGNDGRDAEGFSPSRCDDALTVGAYDVNGKLASFTNYGAALDINAPGVNIYSTTLPSATAGAFFGRKSGTSMASPHAAAVAALYAAANPGSTAAQIAAGVVANSTDRGAPVKYSNKITSTKPKLDGRDYLAPLAP